ncbi:MAG: extracellular solute-binding protein [Solirubrobacterales bacterium]|nr:extracellular solute-binding protein [Solirubrobacterales bacterium]
MSSPITRRRFLTAAGGAAALMVGAGCSSTYDIAGGFVNSNSGSGANTIVYWNLLTGGDGSHMQTMEAAYRHEHPEVNLESTVLEWGNPYYTKLAMATRAGSPPDVAIMHLSRLGQFAPANLLTPLDLDVLADHGMTPADFTPAAFVKAHHNGRLLAIPLDTHPFVQYYDLKVCRRAGLLNSFGHLPPITGAQQLVRVLRRIKATGAIPAVCDQINDPSTPWRLFYTLYSQAGGSVLSDDGKELVLNQPLAVRVLTFIGQLAREGLVVANEDADGGVTVFQAGNSGLYWEGEWNVNTLQQAGLPFSMQPFPAVFGPAITQADSHSFVIPVQPHRDPQKLSTVLTMVHSLLGQSLVWAGGGHIPAWLPVRESAGYQKLKPQSNYQSAADHAVYDPPAWYSGSGSNLEIYAGGAVGGLMLGAGSPESAYDELHSTLQQLTQERAPV